MKFMITDPDIILAPHQLKAVEFILSRKTCCINYEQQTGSGKTFISLQACFELFEKGEIEKALVVCTKSSIQSFEDDITHTNYDPKNLTIIRKEEQLEALEKPQKQIFIIQYEILQNISINSLIRAFKPFKSILIIDEVHRVKTAGKIRNQESITAACLVALKKYFKKLVGLTATTITADLEDLYRILNYIKPGCLGGYKWFAKMFFVTEEGERYIPKYRKSIKYTKVVRYKNLEKLDQYLKPVVIKYFPKLDYRFHLLTKSLVEGSQRAEKYDEIAKSAGCTEEEVAQSSAMPRLQRLIDKSPAKKFLLQTVAKRCWDEGLIVYSRTRKGQMLEHIRAILEDIGYTVKEIKGKTKRERRKAIQRWCFAGSPVGKALVINDAAGQSMNLHWTRHLVFFEIPMGIGRFLQIKGRIGRMFSKWENFHFYFLLIKNTIDEYWYLKFVSNKELMKMTGSDIAIPKSKMNKFDEHKLKKERDRKIWRKNLRDNPYKTYAKATKRI